MPGPGFLADNELRTYPFPSDRPPTMTRTGGGDVDLPDDAIVDFRALIGPAAGWRPGADAVYLHSVARSGDAFTFEFRSTAAALAGTVLAFRRDLGGPEFAASAHDATVAGTGSSSVGGAPGDPCDPYQLFWYGTLVTGRMDGLAAALAPGQSLSAADGLLAVEPALVQDMALSYVSALNLANVNRTHATPPAGCRNPSPHSLYGDDACIKVATCLVGNIVLRPGFNCDIQQDDRAVALAIGAAAGAGAGVPCGEVPAYPGEVPPPGSTLLTGGPACDEVISGVNGLSAANLTLRAGAGITIVADPDDPHALIISVDAVGMADCALFVDSSHSSR